jgi:hypothetical protein
LLEFLQGDADFAGEAGEGQNITHQQKKMGLEGRGPLFSLHDTVIKINMQPKLQLLRALTILSQGPLSREKLTIPVGSVLPLADASRAHEMLAGTRPHERGKIVLEIVA